VQIREENQVTVSMLIQHLANPTLHRKIMSFCEILCSWRPKNNQIEFTSTTNS